MSKKLTSLVISIILLSLIPIEMTSGSDIDLSLPLGFESISPAQSSVIYDDHFDLKGRLKDNFRAKLVKFKGEQVEIVDNGFEIKDIRLKEGVNTFLIDMTDINGKRRLVSYSVSSEKKKLNLGGGSLVETVAFNSGLTAEGYSEPGPRRKALTVVTTSYTPSQYQSSASQYTASSADVVFTSPYFDQVITENKLKIGGKFNKDAGISSITVNGQSCTLDKADGTFEGPTLVSPGEARRKKINSDSAEYIIMKVNPENHSGKNELKVVIKPEDGKAYEDRVGYYYYQLFVKADTYGESLRTFEDGTTISLPVQNTQSYNRDLFYESPYANWVYPEKAYRNENQSTYLFHYDYSSDMKAFYFTENCPHIWASLASGKVYASGRSRINTNLILHAPPKNDSPLILVLRDVAPIESLPIFTGWTRNAIANYKFNNNTIFPLVYGSRYNYYDYCYVVIDDFTPDQDFYVNIETPDYLEGFRWYGGYCNKSFSIGDIQTLSGDILMDSNNDGFLGGDDNAREMVSPGCVFWVNDDDDYNESSAHSYDNNSNLASGECDAYDDRINGIRDLEDFMPINIAIPNIKEWASSTDSIKFVLKAIGTGKIRVFKRVEDSKENGPLSYLKELDKSVKQYQVTEQFEVCETDKSEEVIELDPSLFDKDGVFRGIFEGVKEGSIKIILGAQLEGKNKKSELIFDELYITLVNVKQMFKVYNTRYNSGEGDCEGPTVGEDELLRYRFIREQKGYGSRFPEAPDRVIIWTHGYNNSVSESLKNMETLFKRLYSTGYRGGFIGVVWHVHRWHDDFDITDKISWMSFDPDWEKSYRSGHVFADIIRNTRKSYPDAKLDLFMHSLGANLGCYALRILSDNNERIVDNLILHEAAVPGEVFTGKYKTKFNYPGLDPILGYPLIFRAGLFDNIYGDIFNILKGKVYNTYCDEDKAISVALPAAGFLGLSTPLEDDYEFCNLATRTVANSKYTGLGCSKIDTQKYSDRIVNFHGLIDSEAHPYGIRDHGSQTSEYYFDVKFFFECIYDLNKMEELNKDKE